MTFASLRWFFRHQYSKRYPCKESAELAEKLIANAIYEHEVGPDVLTLHADRGAAMTSKTVSQLLADLCVTRTHSRPYTSNDNPYSESQFKTLKYHSSFPKTFPTLEDAKQYLQGWFKWYNEEHRHSGIEMLTPNDVHYGRAEEVILKRQAVLDKAYDKKSLRSGGVGAQQPL
ncbi:MAG: transposase family protein [Planctomycetes bacterium]|nr:transposase family protein [Planctomycetota bacterium]